MAGRSKQQWNKRAEERSAQAIAYRLRITREALGFNQLRFAKEIGVDKNTYNPWEQGEDRTIPRDKAQRIKDRFGVSLDWIYDGDPANLPTGIYTRIQQRAA